MTRLFERTSATALRLVLATVVITAAGSGVRAAWTPQVSGSIELLQGVHFLDASNGYAAGELDILKTIDGGATWVTLTWDEANPLDYIHFVDVNTGYVVGDKGEVQKTIDGGTTWTPLDPGTNKNLDGVYFTSATAGVVVGAGGTIKRTTTGGSSWSSPASGTNEGLEAVHFVDASTGYIVGSVGTILKSMDGGATWVALTSGTIEDLNGVHFVDTNTGWAVGKNGTILKTTNAGTTWVPQVSGTGVILHAVHFVDSSRGYLVGVGGTILKTTNGGASWAPDPSGTGQTLIDVHFGDTGTGYAVGANGTILKTIDYVGVSGVVFEDADFAGTASGWDGGVGDAALPNVDVELYDNADSYIASTTTDGSGQYSFTGLADGSYKVRVRSATIGDDPGGPDETAPRGDFKACVPATCAEPLPEMTWGYGSALYGGQDPEVDDTTTADDAGPGDTYVSVTVSGAAVSAVNIGFAYNLIVNTDDDSNAVTARSKQGSLRQFIKNANGIGATGGTTASSSEFRIPTSDDGYDSGSGVYTVSLATGLPTLTDSGTTLDGSTQTTNVGDSNAGVVGSGGTVGVDAIALPQYERPEVAIDANGADGLIIGGGASDILFKGFAIYDVATVGVHSLTGAGINRDVESILVGTFADGTDPGAQRNQGRGIQVQNGGQLDVTRCLVGWSGLEGVEAEPDGSLMEVTYSEVFGNCWSATYCDGIDLNGSSNIARYNLSRENTTSDGLPRKGAGNGIECGSQAAGTGNHLVENNTVYANVGAGIVMRNGASGVSVGRNIVRNNEVGVAVDIEASGQTNHNTITRNSIYQNNLLGIDLHAGGAATPYDGVTLNDTGDADSGSNDVLNFPVLDTATINGANLELTGWARPGVVIEVFVSNSDPTDFGEGQEWKITLTEGGTGAGGEDPYADTDSSPPSSYGPGAVNGIVQGQDTTNRFSFTFPTPTGVSVGTELTATARDGSGNTSEFSGLVTAAATISGTVFEDVNYGGGAGRDQATASGVARSAARVELYDAAGAYVNFTTTDGSGNYSFAGLAAGNHTVRVVNSTVTSSRTGYVPGLLAVQTFRTDAVSGSAVAVADHVGGQNPGLADAGNAGAGTVMNTTTGVFTAGISGIAQSITTVTIGASSVPAVDFGFNFDSIVNTNNSGQGSLRQFKTNSNALDNTGLVQAGRTAGIDNAIFMLADGTARPGLNAGYPSMFVGGIATISLNSLLLGFTDPVILDATTQPGFSGTPVIELNGFAAGGSDGMTLSGGGSTLKGWIINRFNANGVYMSGSGGNTLRGNRIGTNAAGTAASPNSANGVSISGPGSHVIGGTAPGDGNIISGNLGNGISIQPASSSGNLIQGNFIGTNASGADLGNTLNGLRITSGSANVIGGTADDAGNVIAYNLLDGVLIRGATATQNAVLSNSIYSNGIGTAGAIGIDLHDDGVTVNNGTKNAAMSNSDMDSPVFTSALLSGTTLTVAGYVGSAPGQPAFANARVEIFKSDGDASGHGQGREYFDFLTADASGNFSGSVTVSGLAGGDEITGTATDASNNTSEFGLNASVAAARQLVKRAFQADGTPIASDSTLPSGLPVKFLIYVANYGGALTDMSVRDVLDPAFQYQVGSMKIDDTLQASVVCPAAVCDEAAIFAQVDGSGTPVGEGDSVTAPIDPDEASYDGGTRTIDVGDQNNTDNAQLNVGAGRVWALVLTIRMQ